MNATLTLRMKSTRSEVYKHLLTRKDFESKIEKMRAAKLSQCPSIDADLREMFRALDIEISDAIKRTTEDSIAETGKDIKNGIYFYYSALADAYSDLVANSNIPEFKDIEGKILQIMYENFENYPTPTAYMQRIVDRLSDPEDGWQGDSLRLRILKQFIKYCNCLSFQSNSKTVRVYGGNSYLRKYAKEKKGASLERDESILPYIDDAVFDVLHNATKEQKKPDGPYGILTLSDDLAQGAFKAGGATKKALYMFAIAFHMTYAANENTGALETEDISTYKTDIKKNLFEDYYTNNLMRFITDTYLENLNAFELDPSGVGINYKNYSEMIYIYFISKDYEPIEKLRQATVMIERLKGTKAEEMPNAQRTQYFRELLTEDILSKDEKAFESFIKENYDCTVEYTYTNEKGQERTGKKSVLQIQDEQETAFTIYQRFIKEIEKAAPNDPSFLQKNCTYGLWFSDVDFWKENGVTHLKGILEKECGSENVDGAKVEKLVQLLRGINMFLNAKKMSIEESNNMSRAALIAAYYYRYNQLHEALGSGKSFVDVMDDYTDSESESGLNYLLKESGYQLINDRNIFDLTVVFSSYAYLSM